MANIESLSLLLFSKKTGPDISPEQAQRNKIPTQRETGCFKATGEVVSLDLEVQH